MVNIDLNNTTIELEVGQILQIELPGNVGTGLEWRLVELDETLLEFRGSSKKIFGKDNPGLTGNPYLKFWTFKVIQSGTNRVRLLYYSPWESKDMALKTFEIKVVVKP